MAIKDLRLIGIDSKIDVLQYEKPFMLVINRGERLISSILAGIQQAEINSATLLGIGALEEPKLGYYNFEKKQYQYKIFHGFYELISLSGNITKYNEKYIVHVHAALGNEYYQTIAGHLDEAIVGVTAEISIFPFKATISRKYVSEFNANLISLARF